jgi:hypothetical protein
MADLKIECNYELNPLLREILGARLDTISGNQCIFGLLKPPTLSCFGEIQFATYNEKSEAFTTVQLLSKGHESFAGNLYGIELGNFLSGDRKKFIGQPTYTATVMGEFGVIIKIVGLGEVRDEVIFTEGTEEQIVDFFPANSILPAMISINKKTLEVIGFLFDSGKWLYLFADGEGHFRIEFEMAISPEELCVRWDYIAMEKNLTILEVFE